VANVYRDKGAAERYDAARHLPDETAAAWMRELQSSVPARGLRGVLDLGCGTGRFTTALAEALGCRAVGVEPSEAMLEVARARARDGVRFERGDAERIPLGAGSVDLVFMSQVYHHLADRGRALAEVRRVLARGGHLAIRNGTLEHLDALEWLAFFPQARELEARRLPPRAALERAVCGAGFVLVSSATVLQLFEASYREYFEKIRGRGLSSLLAIADEAFEAGVERFGQWTRGRPPDVAVYEPVDLFVFRRARPGSTIGPGAFD
jgi:ubiquinone/menaquinone biosynthesis C-methylase UbiE